MTRKELIIEDDAGEPVVIPSMLEICSKCKGEGKMDNPAFSNGFTSTEWHEMDGEDQDRYMSGAYDVACTGCSGCGMVRVPDIGRTTFAQRRLLVLKRREARDERQYERECAAERRQMGMY